MADKEQTPPPGTTADSKSSPVTPISERARMSCPERTAEKAKEDVKKEDKNPMAAEKVREKESACSDSAALPEATTAELLDEEDEESDLEADDDYADSAFGGSDKSDDVSITSSVAQGIIENGRRYQAKREGEYWGPADEKQFLSMEAAHIVYLLLESKRKNRYFLSPISETAQNILDVGTGSGIWAKEVADEYPSAVVHGIDLSPPPQHWVPPNCKLEVDDVLKAWNYGHKFELVHLRDMQASFSNEQWRLVYKQAYSNISPGGWIEHVEAGIEFYSDDGSLAPDSLIAKWGSMFYPLFEKMGNPADTMFHVKRRIEAAGFTNVHEKTYKVPLGDWVKDPVLKEVGRFCKTQLLEGMEGYTMFVMTRFGEPTPWTPEEVHVFLAKARQEVNDPKLHAYFLKKRVWAQKPFNSE